MEAGQEAVMNERRLTHVIRLLQDAPHSIPMLALLYGVQHRTVRRWLEEIESRGIRIVREGTCPTSPYRILKSGKKNR